MTRREMLFTAAVLLIVGLALACGGCCAAPLPERKRAAEDALAAWRIVRAATVPHPTYGQAEREELERAEDKLEAALVKLATAEGD